MRSNLSHAKNAKTIIGSVSKTLLCILCACPSHSVWRGRGFACGHLRLTQQRMRFCVLFALLFVGSSAVAQQCILKDDTDEVVFMPYELNYLMDSTNQLTLADVASEARAQDFKTHAAYQNKDFRTNTSYWIRMSITL